MALLEVLLALVLVAITGVGLMRMLGQSTMTVARTQSLERRQEAADRRLQLLAILSAAELDARVGAHQVGEWEVSVSTPGEGLYRIVIADTNPEGPRLETVVYRPEVRNVR